MQLYVLGQKVVQIDRGENPSHSARSLNDCVPIRALATKKSPSLIEKYLELPKTRGLFVPSHVVPRVALCTVNHCTSCPAFRTVAFFLNQQLNKLSHFEAHQGWVVLMPVGTQALCHGRSLTGKSLYTSKGDLSCSELECCSVGVFTIAKIEHGRHYVLLNQAT